MTKALAKYLTILVVDNLEQGKFTSVDATDSNKIQSWFENGQFDKVEEFINKIS